MRIDHERARAILREEAERARPGAEPAWEARLSPVIRAAMRTNRTFIAALGTGILAKATDLRANPLALKVSGGDPGSYSARALAKDVLAAEAIRLGIHIGVTGREPLNNQPFFRYEFINNHMAVHARAREALRMLVECLEQVGRITSEDDARAALRAFVALRRVPERQIALNENSQPQTVPELAKLVDRWVREDSEGGRRAQAVVAGMLSVVFGQERVLTSRVNDPDRRVPGDVAVLSPDDPSTFHRLYEVRDKPVGIHDVLFFVEKVSNSGGSRAVVVAASDDQKEIDLLEASSRAADRSVLVIVEDGWLPFISRALMETRVALRDACISAYQQIADRALELEVSDEGLQSWARGTLTDRQG